MSTRIAGWGILIALSLAGPAGARAEDRVVAAQASVRGLALEDATLEDARAALGPAALRHNGGEGSASAWYVCYAGPDGTTLVLESQAETGGGVALTSFQLLSRADLADTSGDPDALGPLPLAGACTALPTLGRAAATDGGLRLGMDRAAVEDLLGAPAEAGADRLVYVMETRVPMTAEEAAEQGATEDPRWYRWRTVRVELERGRVVAIRVVGLTC